jgi:Protein of unknwon function (DUF3310)
MKMTDKIRRLLAKGASTAEIAKKLKIKPAYVHTVKWLDKKTKAKQKVQVERSHDPKVVKVEQDYLKTVKTAMDAIQKKPTKLFIQPQHKDAALKLLDMKEADLVNSPPHYKSGGIETIDFIEAKDLNYRLGNVIKYVSRAGKKGDPIQDLEKAAWYLQREITARKNA